MNYNDITAYKYCVEGRKSGEGWFAYGHFTTYASAEQCYATVKENCDVDEVRMVRVIHLHKKEDAT